MNGLVPTWLVQLIGAWGVIGAAFWALTRWWKWKRGQARDFFHRREPQVDDQFLAGCGIGSDSTPAKIALGARQVLAELAGVPVESIHSSDRFDSELQWLAFCQRFYPDEFAERFHRITGLVVDEAHLGQVPNVDVPPHAMTVESFIGRMVLLAKSADNGGEA